MLLLRLQSLIASSSNARGIFDPGLIQVSGEQGKEAKRQSNGCHKKRQTCLPNSIDMSKPYDDKRRRKKQIILQLGNLKVNVNAHWEKASSVQIYLRLLVRIGAQIKPPILQLTRKRSNHWA